MPCKIFIKQHDTSDCGAACLATVAWYHGLKMPISRIRHYAHTDRKGTTALGMVKAAEQLGFAAQAVRGTDVALDGLPLPAIAHIRLDSGGYHFVVVFKVSKRYVEVSDPARGFNKLPREEFLERWTGVLILLAPNLTFTAAEAL